MKRSQGRKKLDTRSFSAVDLFSGCGGLTRGLTSAGFRVRAAVEIDQKAQRTYSLNFPNVRLYKQDIRDLSAKSLLRGIRLRRGGLDLLAGCPPCQGFSRLRTRNQHASIEDPRNDLINEFLRFVRVLLPKTIMLENVPSLESDSRFKALLAALVKLRYKVVVQVLNAADYSVPQRRKRLILLGSRLSEPKLAPKATQRLTVRHALATIEHPTKTKDRLHAIPENRAHGVRELIKLIPMDGGSRADLPANYTLECHKRSDGFRDVYGRMAWDEVSPTITSGCINPSRVDFSIRRRTEPSRCVKRRCCRDFRVATNSTSPMGKSRSR